MADSLVCAFQLSFVSSQVQKAINIFAKTMEPKRLSPTAKIIWSCVPGKYCARSWKTSLFEAAAGSKIKAMNGISNAILVI